MKGCILTRIANMQMTTNIFHAILFPNFQVNCPFNFNAKYNNSKFLMNPCKIRNMQFRQKKASPYLHCNSINHSFPAFKNFKNKNHSISSMRRKNLPQNLIN